MIPLSGAAISSFDYTERLEKVIRQIVETCPPLSYINPDSLLAGWSQSRVGGEHGVYATIQPLRFEGGGDTALRGKHIFRWPRLTFQDREILYLIQFMMPRFANLPYRKKLTTIFHELYHVGPHCDGDLRRFPGKNYAHGHSREAYNARLQPWIDGYLLHPQTSSTTDFLNLNFAELQQHYPVVTGRRIKPLHPVQNR